MSPTVSVTPRLPLPRPLPPRPRRPRPPRPRPPSPSPGWLRLRLRGLSSDAPPRSLCHFSGHKWLLNPRGCPKTIRPGMGRDFRGPAIRGRSIGSRSSGQASEHPRKIKHSNVKRESQFGNRFLSSSFSFVRRRPLAFFLYHRGGHVIKEGAWAQKRLCGASFCLSAAVSRAAPANGPRNSVHVGAIDYVRFGRRE